VLAHPSCGKGQITVDKSRLSASAPLAGVVYAIASRKLESAREQRKNRRQQAWAIFATKRWPEQSNVFRISKCSYFFNA
jgi:hypothetical protein